MKRPKTTRSTVLLNLFSRGILPSATERAIARKRRRAFMVMVLFGNDFSFPMSFRRECYDSGYCCWSVPTPRTRQFSRYLMIVGDRYAETVLDWTAALNVQLLVLLYTRRGCARLLSRFHHRLSIRPVGRLVNQIHHFLELPVSLLAFSLP